MNYPIKQVISVLLAALFFSAGCLHFAYPELFVQIVPAYLPQPRLLVLISGLAEIIGGIGLLVPRTKRWSGYGLIALLIAVFPANVNMAQHHITFHTAIPSYLLWARLPIQFILIACVWYCIKNKETSAA